MSNNNIPHTELSLALGVVGFGVWETYKSYRDSAPGLDELRNTTPVDVEMGQHLRDADIMLGGLVVIAGATASLLARSPVPIIVAIVGFCWVSGCHHAIYRSPPS